MAKIYLDDWLLGSFLAEGGGAAALGNLWRKGLIEVDPEHGAKAEAWLEGRNPGPLPRADEADTRVDMIHAAVGTPTQAAVDQIVTRRSNPNLPGYEDAPTRSRTKPKQGPKQGSDRPGVQIEDSPAIENEETVDDWIARFPWLLEGATRSELEGFLRDGLVGDTFLNAVRSTATYARNFAGIRREDGSLRASEREFKDINARRRNMLQDYGYPPQAYDDPLELAAWWEADIDLDEMEYRLDTWQTIEELGPDVQDAMYVYAGINVNNEDLFNAITNPAEGRKLSNTYNQRVATQQLDYGTFVTRATEAGLKRVVRQLEKMEDRGLRTQEAIAGVREIDPQFARQMVELLYTGGPGTLAAGVSGQVGQEFLSLPELERAFESALIGSAATMQGLELPSMARIAEFRQVGIQRAQALEAYGTFANRRGAIQGAVERLNRGASFTQEDYEDAVFLASAPETELLSAAEGREASYGRGGGSARFAQDPMGRLRQAGLRPI